MKDKNNKATARYLKNILLYGNPYGPIAKSDPIRVAPVRKFIVPAVNSSVLAPVSSPPDGSAPINPLADPAMATGSPQNAYGGANMNALNQQQALLNSEYSAGPGQADIGLANLGDTPMGWGAKNIEGNPVTGINNANKAIAATKLAMKMAPQTTPIASPLLAAFKMSKGGHAQTVADDVGQSGFVDASQGVAQGFDQEAAASALSGMMQGISGMFGEIGAMMGSDNGGTDTGGDPGAAGTPGGPAGGQL